jgi:ribokinase
MNGHLVVVGSLNMDLVVRSPRHPEPGETIIGGEFRTIPGGKGANQAVAAARLGAQVEMVGRVGADGFGNDLLANLHAVGVDTTHVKQDSEASSGVALIVVDAKGQNTIVVASGANMGLTEEDVNAAASAFEGAAAILLQLESPLPVVACAASLARERGVHVILNPAPARLLDADMLALVDYLIPNESEATLLTGIKVRDSRSRKRAAGKLLKQGVGAVILTLGDRGALLVNGDGAIRVPAFRVKAVDTTAAGDAFVGAFGVALAEGQSPVEAMRFASAAAAISVTREGAQPSMPTRAEVEAFLVEQGGA